MRLLVVEDNAWLAKYVSIACCAKGFVVDLACSLADARHFIAGIRYDAIVLDRGLPDGDGLDWLKEIRRGGFQNPYSSYRRGTPHRQWWKDWTSAPTIT